ncbi:MAG: N-acylneuraminate cytidylyltransferase, partial [Clostridiales bacterium]|nr:N-acylneuraminate cytidylyltransferase [Clostridiales bacterium]
MKILAIIPARGGSKGIPRKNVRLMNGKPLICYAIDNALSVEAITDVVVTSDDSELLEISSMYGAYPIKRSSE